MEEKTPDLTDKETQSNPTEIQSKVNGDADFESDTTHNIENAENNTETDIEEDIKEDSAEDTDDGYKEKKPLPAFVSYLIFALALAAAFFAGQAVKEYCIIPVTISQSSMHDTLGDGDKVYIYKLANINQFDIVVLDDETAGDQWIIKRVIGLEGQEIEILDGILYVTEDGKTTAYIEEYVYGENITLNKTYVPEGCVFVLGDNREASYDSADYGCLLFENIVGKALFINSEKAVKIDISD